MNLEKNAQHLPPFFYGVLRGIAQKDSVAGKAVADS